MNHIWILSLVLAIVPARSEEISSTVPATVASNAAGLSLTNDTASNRITIDGVTYDEVRWGNVTPSTVIRLAFAGVAGSRLQGGAAAQEDFGFWMVLVVVTPVVLLITTAAFVAALHARRGESVVRALVSPAALFAYLSVLGIGWNWIYFYCFWK
jgi:hypothetical protein